MRRFSAIGARCAACLVSAVVSGVLAGAAAWAASPPPPPVSPEAVRNCVLENLGRYATPDQAVVVQYVDLAAACRAALAGSSDTDIQVTPLGSSRTASSSSSNRRSGGASVTSTGSSQRATGARSGPRSKSAGRERGTRPTTRDRSAPATVGVVRSALEGAERPAPGEGKLAGLPLWLLGLLGASLVLAIAGGAAGVRRRRD
jgi:hypothetical protein